MAKKTETTKSINVFDLIKEPMRLEFDTPEVFVKQGLPAKGWVRVMDGVDSVEYLALQLDMATNVDEDGNFKVSSREEQMRLSGKLAAALVVDWDEAYFGPFNKASLEQVMTSPRFMYIQNVIGKHNQERLSFFDIA